MGSASPASVSTQVSTELSLIEAVRLAVQRNPQITQSISSVAAQNANMMWPRLAIIHSFQVV